MRVGVVGSRSLFVSDEVIARHLPEGASVIVSGGAVGVDRCAREFARRHGLEYREFLPEYGKFGRRAPVVRDQLIVDDSEFLLAFHDGVSRGYDADGWVC